MLEGDFIPESEAGDFPQSWRYVLVAVASLVSSVIGILLAAFYNCPSTGGRGGAIGTAIAFVALFVRPDYGLDIYEERMKKPNGMLTPVENELKAVVAALRINSNGQTHQNAAIAVASVIGTIAWGFGDVAALELARFWPLQSLPPLLH